MSSATTNAAALRAASECACAPARPHRGSRRAAAPEGRFRRARAGKTLPGPSSRSARQVRRDRETTGAGLSDPPARRPRRARSASSPPPPPCGPPNPESNWPRLRGARARPLPANRGSGRTAVRTTRRARRQSEPPRDWRSPRASAHRSAAAVPGVSPRRAARSVGRLPWQASPESGNERNHRGGGGA
ncbi:MAG: hypothetical protein BWZ10_02454 [candidate division BRC1 bacterium ADurb.BinA364]|nr:MAG: hypothetical protein BWZ10_02454 [candidate division BRC1 bacterium ADurb.BinA364]